MRAGFYDHTESGYSIKATADSNGLAQGFLGPVPLGFCWYAERYTTFANATRAGATCEVFVQGSNVLPAGFTATVGDRSGRQDVTTSGSNDSADNESHVYVGECCYLVVFWAGFTQNDQLVLSTQIAIHRLQLDLGPRQIERPTLAQLEHAVPQEE